VRFAIKVLMKALVPECRDNDGGCAGTIWRPPSRRETWEAFGNAGLTR